MGRGQIVHSTSAKHLWGLLSEIVWLNCLRIGEMKTGTFSPHIDFWPVNCATGIAASHPLLTDTPLKTSPKMLQIPVYPHISRYPFMQKILSWSNMGFSWFIRYSWRFFPLWRFLLTGSSQSNRIYLRWDNEYKSSPQLTNSLEPWGSLGEVWPRMPPNQKMRRITAWPL